MIDLPSISRREKKIDNDNGHKQIKVVTPLECLNNPKSHFEEVMIPIMNEMLFIKMLLRVKMMNTGHRNKKVVMEKMLEEEKNLIEYVTEQSNNREEFIYQVLEKDSVDIRNGDANFFSLNLKFQPLSRNILKYQSSGEGGTRSRDRKSMVVW